MEPVLRSAVEKKSKTVTKVRVLKKDQNHTKGYNECFSARLQKNVQIFGADPSFKQKTGSCSTNDERN